MVKAKTILNHTVQLRPQRNQPIKEQSTRTHVRSYFLTTDSTKLLEI